MYRDYLLNHKIQSRQYFKPKIGLGHAAHYLKDP